MSRCAVRKSEDHRLPRAHDRAPWNPFANVGNAVGPEGLSGEPFERVEAPWTDWRASVPSRASEENRGSGQRTAWPWEIITAGPLRRNEHPKVVATTLGYDSELPESSCAV